MCALRCLRLVCLVCVLDVMGCLLSSVCSHRGVSSCVCSQACVLGCVNLLVFFGVCQGVAVLTFALCVLWVGGAHSCVQRDICALDAALLPFLVRGSSRG